MNDNRTKKYGSLIFCLIIILISLFSVYFYQVAWGWPVVDSFPQIEKLLNKQFLPADFYTNTFEEFSPRLYVSYFYIFGANVFHVDYTVFIAFVNLLRIFLLNIAVFTLLYVLSNKQTYIALIGMFLGAISFYSIPRTIAWFFSTPVFSAAEFSLVFILFGFVLIYRANIFSSCMLFAIAMLLHPVLTLHGLAIAGLLFVATYNFSEIKSMINRWSILGLLSIIGAFFVSYIPLKLSEKGVALLSSKEYTTIIGDLRHPHHYIPSKFGIENWFIAIMYAVIIIYMMYVIRKRLPASILRFLKLYGLYITFMMAIGYLFVEVVPIKSIVTIIPYRTFVFVPVFYLFIFAYYMYYKLRNKDYLSFLLLHLPFIPVLTQDIKLSTLMMGAVFVYAVWSDWLFAKKGLKLHIYLDRYLMKRIGLHYFYLILVLLAFAGSFFVLDRKLAFNIPDISEPRNELYAWVKEHTAQDAQILADIDVDHLVNQKLRLIANRSVPVSKDFPFNEKYYKEWAERFMDIYDGKYDNAGHINELTQTELRSLMKKYQVDIILRTEKLEGTSYFSLQKTIPLKGKNVYIYKAMQ
ncbi:MAG: DUF6798 domain-containing protein [Bacillota bacterium]|uniref:DUF6798 domain-containing protein n=1 Tax=Virgibacillus salarius TaxID=447199 RepID=A0A941IA24_9BACI|nr:MULTISPECIES: DUF6798 domain-containing protein [Bacillaceae]MBR7797404.1 hypothetical protein [Virgibacillus salarius]NAZ10114.1 hypothetical protein [Agaribacter marinus]